MKTPTMKRLAPTLLLLLLAWCIPAQGMLIQQGSAAHPLLFKMVLQDGYSGATGLLASLAGNVQISKDGATFGPPAGALFEVGYGWYGSTGNANDTSILGKVVVHAAATGAIQAEQELIQIVPWNPDDPNAMGLVYLDTNVGSRLATTGYTTPPTPTQIMAYAPTGSEGATTVAVALYDILHPTTWAPAFPAGSFVNLPAVTVTPAPPTLAQIEGGILKNTSYPILGDTNGYVTITNTIPTPPSAATIATADAAAILATPAQKIVTDINGYTTSNIPAGGITVTQAPNLDAAMSTRAPASTALSTAIWTGTLAGYLNNLSVTPAPASTALSTATWTNTKAGYLDAAVSGAAMGSALTSAISTLEAAITAAQPLSGADRTAILGSLSAIEQKLGGM